MSILRTDKIAPPIITNEYAGAVHFDGTDDWLDIASSSDFAYGTGDFTWEAWINPIAVKTTHYIVDHGNDGGIIQFYDGIIRYYNSTIGVTSILYTGGGTLNYNTWSHIAVSRNSGVSRLFVNGQLRCFAADTHSYSAQAVTIGDYGANTGTNNVQGYISNFRLIKGVGLYTQSFTPPTKELEKTDETVLLCCQSQTDATQEATGKTITVSGHAIAVEANDGNGLFHRKRTSVTTENNGSVYFDSKSYLTLEPSSDFAFGTGDFTIESWVYPTRFGGVFHIKGGIFKDSATNAGIGMGIAANPTNWYVYHESTTAANTSKLGDVNQWNHIALARSSGTTKAFVNGIQVYTDADPTDYAVNYLTIGSWYSTDYSQSGWISNFRIVKGTALYTANFTPPTEPLTSIDGTVLLCCQDSDNPLQEETGKTIIVGDELVSNGDFTSNTTGWTGESGATLSISSNALRVGVTTTAGATQTISVKPGVQYRLKWKVKTDGTNFTNFEINNNGSYQYYGGNETSTSFVDKEYLFTAKGVSITIRPYKATGGWVELDDISIKTVEIIEGPKRTAPLGESHNGVVLNGDVKYTSKNFMVLPKGTTEERGRGRGIFSGGYANPNFLKNIDYIDIASSGNAVEFGEWIDSVMLGEGAQCSNHVTGLVGGGNGSPGLDVIEYITIATTGNGQDFGDLTQNRRSNGAVGNNTKGIFAGGTTGSSSDVIDFVTIASTGDAADFGNLSVARRNQAPVQSSTRGIWGGGNPGSSPYLDSTIDYITMATSGDAKDFGDLVTAMREQGGASSGTRGLITGGYSAPSFLNGIEYITIATLGNAQDFGDLFIKRSGPAGVSNSINGLFGGGSSPSLENVIDYVKIATLGNAQDFGDLTYNVVMYAGQHISDSHGGVS